MNVSVIIPVLDEEKTIAATLRELIRLQPHEIIVVEGGSGDRTCEIAEEFGVQVLRSERGRARQMNNGARRATGDALLFLHADTKLPASALRDIASALTNAACVGGRFDVDLEGRHWMLKVIGALINYRSRATKVGTGDQAIFVRREVFMRIGGYPDMLLMEDIALCRTLKRLGAIACLHSRVITSGRRWENDGVWRTIVRMWTLKFLYLAGVSPARLKQFYADSR